MANTRGRQPIGFNQPPGGGTNYPFVTPSADIEYLLGDFFVSFDDLSDSVVYPLRVAWLYGFGTNSVSPPTGYPTPEHTHDLVVVDNNGETVFDSTQADTFTSDVWDSRLLILEWRTSDKILRCTQHTDWTTEDIRDGQDRTYDNYIVPQDGTLQADTWFKLPKRVTSIQVGLTNIKGTAVSLAEGYNTQITEGSSLGVPDIEIPSFGFDTGKKLVEGKRLSHKVSLAAVPGAGLGIFPGCADTQPELKTINKIRSSEYFNFTWDAEGCIRYQRPLGLVSASPREFSYASVALPSTEESSSAIEVLNDCQNCCQCTYFAQTYQGIKRQWYLYKDIAANAEKARDNYSDSRDRWTQQKAIREANTLRVFVRQDGDCKISWGLSHCNASKCCLNNIRLQLMWLYYVDGKLTVPDRAGFDCQKTQIDGSAQCDSSEDFVLSYNSNGTIATGGWDYADPYGVTSVYGRHCFPDCFLLESQALRVRLWAALTWDSSPNPDTKEDCTYPPNRYSADALSWFNEDVEDSWLLNQAAGSAGDISELTDAGYQVQKITPLSDLDKESPYCSRCKCEDPGE
jgi:hypothetical protein